MYSFFGFDYMILFVLGLSKYPKDSEMFKIKKMLGVGASVILCYLLTLVMYKIYSVKPKTNIQIVRNKLANKKLETNQTITEAFFHEIKYAGIKNDHNLLKKSHFVRNYNVYFYCLINGSVVVMITFTNSGLLSVFLMVMLHLWFNVTTAVCQFRHSFMISRCEFVLRFFQGVFILVFMSVLLHMSIRQEFNFTVSEGLNKNSVLVLLISLGLAVFCEMVLGAKNIISEIMRFRNSKKKKTSIKNKYTKVNNIRIKSTHNSSRNILRQPTHIPRIESIFSGRDKVAEVTSRLKKRNKHTSKLKMRKKLVSNDNLNVKLKQRAGQ